MCDVGILTFHCADNFGAMLQAYGLKTYLCGKGIEADIVPYEPPFMTGRHWWIPYVPIGGPKRIIRHGWNGWRRNLRLGMSFFESRRNMRRFRRKYLIRKGQRRLLFAGQLRKLSYHSYIVGSDQIWNPEITLGLRKEYFGDFISVEKKKVIAYAASLGGASLAPKYDGEFSELLKAVDEISVRENVAIPYIRQFCGQDIYAVPDPVFLLRKEEWEKIERLPDKRGYIFVYMMEKNDALIKYVNDLAEKEGLLILKLKDASDFNGENVCTDHIAGPAEYIGYIHKADYVVTNSFHGVAFSIIFQKDFVAFQHSSVGARISNILELCGLEDRLYQEDIKRESKIQVQDRTVNWDRVQECIEENVKIADQYLMTGLKG